MSERNWIKIEMMYRDAGNWKTRQDHYYPNKTGITVEQLEKALDGAGGNDPIIVQFYGMKSIAPIEPGEDGDRDDHPYCEVEAFEAVERPNIEYGFVNLEKDIEVIYNKMLDDPDSYDINRIYKEGAKYCNE